MILFRLVAQIVTSPHFFGDWQIEDSIRKIFSVRAWRCHLKVTIWLKAFTTSITNIIIDYMMIFRLAASIWTFTTSDDFQDRCLNCDFHTFWWLAICGLNLKMFSVREWRCQIKVTVCNKAFITSIPAITLNCLIIYM